jgi:hypothetical protein
MDLPVRLRPTFYPLMLILGTALGAACGARTEIPGGQDVARSRSGGLGGLSTTVTTSASSSSNSSATVTTSSSSGTGGGCTTDAECGCLLNCCGGRCVNEANDILNCGACGKTCSGTNPYCNQGACAEPPCEQDAGACCAGSFCCGTQCCPPGQLCCTVNVALTFTKCQVPTATGTCDIGAPCTACASPDTPIATPEGERAIASLGVGDLVYSVEGEATVVVPILRIGRTLVRSYHQVVEAVLANGAVLRISPRHPTADGRLFGDLVAGDHLGEVEVVRVRLVPYDDEYTYDILPASSAGAYFAGGALVGSTIEGK